MYILIVHDKIHRSFIRFIVIIAPILISNIYFFVYGFQKLVLT